MNKYVYLITDRNRDSLHVGMSNDLIETMVFYHQISNLAFDAGQQLSRLVYFEEFTSESLTMQRFQLVSRFTRAQKNKIIQAVNPDWIDLTTALKFENNWTSV